MPMDLTAQWILLPSDTNAVVKATHVDHIVNSVAVRTTSTHGNRGVAHLGYGMALPCAKVCDQECLFLLTIAWYTATNATGFAFYLLDVSSSSSSIKPFGFRQVASSLKKSDLIFADLLPVVEKTCR